MTFKNNLKIRVFLLWSAVVCAAIGVAAYLLFHNALPLPAADFVLFPVVLFLWPVVYVLLFGNMVQAEITDQCLRIRGRHDRGRGLGVWDGFREPTKDGLCEVAWDRIFALVRAKHYFCQTVDYIYFINPSEEMGASTVEDLQRAIFKLSGIRGNEKLTDEVRSRAANAALIYGERNKDNFMKWGISEEKTEVLAALRPQHEKAHVAILFAGVAFLYFLAFLMYSLTKLIP